MLPSYQPHLHTSRNFFLFIIYDVHNLTGHGFCESCTDQLFPTLGNTARCPNCRKFFHQRDGHPLYLELVDSKLAVATELTESFGQMNVGTPLSSLKEASVKLEQVSKETQHRVVVSVLLFFLKQAKSPFAFKQTPLQSAIKDFNERIIPHFTTVENQKQEIEALRKELHRSHRERDLMQTNVDRIVSLPLSLLVATSFM